MTAFVLQGHIFISYVTYMNINMHVNTFQNICIHVYLYMHNKYTQHIYYVNKNVFFGWINHLAALVSSLALFEVIY